MITLDANGLFCSAGGFHIDPWRPVATALVTHAHADHARPGHAEYIAAAPGAALLRHRLSRQISLRSTAYGERLRLGDATVSFHPAGHVLGSAQVRVEVGGEVWVVTGDYKRDPDPTCAPFEVVPCDTLITEATFALPVYRWRPAHEVAADLLAWWRANAAEGRTSVVFSYALGKAQRLLAELAAFTDDTVYLHGAMTKLTRIYRKAGVRMVPARPLGNRRKGEDFSQALVLAPPSAAGTPWMRRFPRHATGFASGWMRIRGNRRRRGYDRGFVLSDHADWPGLIRTVEETGAKRVLATHGRSDVLVRYLRERGIDADSLEAAFADAGESGG